MKNLQGNSSVFPALTLFLVVWTFATGGKEGVATHAPAPETGKPRPAVYALLQVVRRPDVSTPDVFHRRAKPFKQPILVYPAVQEPQVRSLKVIKEQAKPHEWLRDHLKLDFFDDTGVFKLSLDGGTLEEQALILSAILQLSSREEEMRQKSIAKTIQGLKEALADDKAGIAQEEKVFTDGTVERLPPQINRAQYIQDVYNSIESRKATMKAREKLIEEREKRLHLMPDVRVLEWPVVPDPK